MTAVNDVSDRQFIAAHVLSTWPDDDDAQAGLHLIEVRNRLAVALARSLAEQRHAEQFGEPSDFAFVELDHFREADLLVQEISCDCVDTPMLVLTFLQDVAAGAR